jgi:SPP1 family predicted phage head-tail adaptor
VVGLMGVLNAGELDRRVTLQKYALTRNADNEPLETWSDIRTVWASWRRASARETLAGAEINASATDIFEIRYAADLAELDAKDRLVFGGKTYDIVGIAEIGRREGLRIDATRSADGNAA